MRQPPQQDDTLNLCVLNLFINIKINSTENNLSFAYKFPESIQYTIPSWKFTKHCTDSE